MKIECLIFDCDGLMFDTEYHVKNSWLKILHSHGVEVDDHLFDMVIGAGYIQFHKAMDQYPEVEKHLPEIRADRLPALHAAIERLGNINRPGLVELLTWLKTQPYKTCIASSSPTDYVKWLISTIGMDFDFDAIIGGDQVSDGKPNPEIFLKAAELTNTAPEHCLVLEDSKNGHLAAKAAKMHRCFIEDLVKPDKEMETLIEFQCSSLDEVIPLLNSLQ